MKIYMKLGSINGDVEKTGYEKWVDLDSANFAASRHVSMEPGSIANRSRTSPSLTEISISRKSDASSEGLMRSSLTTTAGEECKIDFVLPVDKNAVEPFQKMILTDAIISSYSQSVSKDGDPYESITISYSKIDVEFTSRDKTGGGASPAHVIYDLAKAESS